MIWAVTAVTRVAKSSFSPHQKKNMEEKTKIVHNKVK